MLRINRLQSFSSRFGLATRLCVLLAGTLCVLTLSGCASLWPGKEEKERDKSLSKLLKVPEPPNLVREAALSRGLNAITVQGVGAVNGLPGTGAPADPSPLRDQLIEEMKRHDVKDPNKFLEINETALVQVEAIIPAGARRGDPVDIIISTPTRSKATDLNNGWLMDTRLRHQQLLQNSVRQSEVMAIGTGPVLTRASYRGGEDPTLALQGKVIGGGRVQIERKLGLILRPEFQHVKMSAALAAAVNRRFFFFDGTTRRGIATATEDDYIEVEVHPRYRGQEARLLSIVGAIGVKPESNDTQQRLIELGRRMREPATAADAANQLEAIGESAIPTLVDVLQSDNPELRFYAAEALAYMDRVEAIEPLEQAAKSEPAFRYPAIAALEGFEQHLALASLRRLLDTPSLETRYGAFRAIRRRADGRVTLAPKTLGDSFRMYRIESAALPAVVVATQETPEIVLMGATGSIKIDDFLFGNDGLLLKPEPGQPGQIRITRFRPGQEDQRTVVPDKIENVIAGIVALGGGYGDVVSLLRKAKNSGCFSEQLAFDPLPKPLRVYYREDTEESTDESAP